MAHRDLSHASDQCCLLVTAGEGHKVHADAVPASETAVHKGDAEPALHSGSISEKGVVYKGSYGANPTIGEAYKVAVVVANKMHQLKLTLTPPLTHLRSHNW